ncbi:conserved hypothetical protein [Planktothrix serta PCC 8927]|uniref:DUF4435 domain-containing protein n=1 Tax=Planktothrix serta PCC 8927 TaxID=671068 RepID=A0A7Z9DYQ6_9CYAN|nr:DUF4435 domain-containing protein [Planktothrix serta]VXD16300.1 conserved hypothetical protein [Planktothrix serta PCC 8927]
MSVVSGGKIIFCEGKDTSLDYQLLSKIIADISGFNTIVPVGGKFNFSLFSQGYFARYETINQPYIFFSDRDFDVKPTSNIQLLLFANNQSRFLSYRACIENYFLDADLIHNYWLEKFQGRQENPTTTWAYGDSPGIDKISEWIQNSAMSLKNYQSVRWALGDLTNMGAARRQLRTTWTGKSGQLPNSLTLQDCKTQALEMISEFRQAVETVTPEEFENRLNLYHQQFDQEEFWIEKQYLIWFHGKDIQKEMQRQQNKYISLNKEFFKWAIQNLDINQHPDLIQLRERIRNL